MISKFLPINTPIFSHILKSLSSSHREREREMDANVVKKTSSSYEEIRMIRAAMRLILIILLIGFAFIWIIMPTNTYKQTWQPRIKAKVNNSTYFGSQGSDNYSPLIAALTLI